MVYNIKLQQNVPLQICFIICSIFNSKSLSQRLKNKPPMGQPEVINGRKIKKIHDERKKDINNILDQ